LRESPAFRQIRELVAQNPEYIQPLIQQLAESNPQLAHQLAANPELLYQLLGGPGAEGQWEGGDAPPGSTAIHVTEEEAAAIGRVKLVFIYCPLHDMSVTFLHAVSFKPLDFRRVQQLKHSSRVERTRIWLRTFCSRAVTMRRLPDEDFMSYCFPFVCSMKI
jgi:XPC-binding domain